MFNNTIKKKEEKQKTAYIDGYHNDMDGESMSNIDNRAIN